MSIANKLDFAKYPAITVLSQQDLEEKYKKEHPWHPWIPSPLSLLKFYIEKEKPQHVMVDEVPFDKSTWKQLLTLQNWIIAKLVLYFGWCMGCMIWFIIWFLNFQNKVFVLQLLRCFEVVSHLNKLSIRHAFFGPLPGNLGR